MRSYDGSTWTASDINDHTLQVNSLSCASSTFCLAFGVGGNIDWSFRRHEMG